MKKQSKPAKKMTIQPLSDRVLVKREEAPAEKSLSGLIMPDTVSKEKSKLGVVVAVGPGRVSDEGKLIATSVKVGAEVVFNAGWDNEVDLHDDNEYFLVKESDILAIIK